VLSIYTVRCYIILYITFARTQTLVSERAIPVTHPEPTNHRDHDSSCALAFPPKYNLYFLAQMGIATVLYYRLTPDKQPRFLGAINYSHALLGARPPCHV